MSRLSIRVSIYSYEYDPCQRFEFRMCQNKNSEADLKDLSKDNEEYQDDEEFGRNRDDFVEIPAFVWLCTGVTPSLFTF